MFKALRLGSTSKSASSNAADLFDPPLIAREDLFSARDYLRPMAGGAVYAIICSVLFTLPLVLSASFIPLLIAFAISAILIVEMSFMMGLSALIHHRVFLHRLRKYGPQFYSSEVTVDAPAAEAFELCLAATSDLPKSKIVGLDEKNGAIMVSMKGNFWITVDRQVTLKVRPFGTDKSIVSVDPSIKLTPIRKKLIRLIWGDKWYPLIFRSDVNWNRKIINSLTAYIESVPNWDHRYDPPELMDHGFTAEMAGGQANDLARRSDAA
jgi:hypothetical protein